MKLFFAFACLIGLCAGLYYSIFESYQVQYFLNDDGNSTQSYKTYKDGIILELKRFAEDSLREGNASIREWAYDFDAKLKNEMVLFTRLTSKEIYNRFHIYSTLDSSEVIINKLVSVLEAMKFISRNRGIVVKASILAGTFKTLSPILKDELKCSEVRSPDKCYALERKLDQLSIKINWNNVNFDRSTSVMGVIKQSGFDSNAIANKPHNSRVMLQHYGFKFEKDAKKMVGDANILNEINKMWSIVDTMLNDNVISLLDNLMTDPPEDKYMAQASNIWRIISDVGWGICLTFAIIVFITWIFAALKVGLKSSAAKRQLRRDKYIANLELLFRNKKTSAIDFTAHKVQPDSEEEIQEDPSSVWIYKLLRILHCLFGILILLPCLIAVVSFVTSGVLTTEVCRYMVEEKGVKVADEKIDRFVEHVWENQVKLNLSSFINLRRPSHILNGIFQMCRNTNTSLLESLNLTGIFNASEFMTTFSKLIDSGYATVKTNFDSLNTETLIPVSLIKYIDDGTELIKTFIDGQNYSGSIQELSKPHLTTGTLSSLVQGLESLYDELPTLKKTTPKLKKSLQEYTHWIASFNTLRKKFIILQSNTNLSGDLSYLKSVLLTTGSKLKNDTLKDIILKEAYGKALAKLLTALTSILQSDIDGLERQLFPCQSLHNAYSIFLRAVCGDLRSGLGSFSLSLVMTTLWFQLCFLFSWCLVSTLNPPFTPEDCTNC